MVIDEVGELVGVADLPGVTPGVVVNEFLVLLELELVDELLLLASGSSPSVITTSSSKPVSLLPEAYEGLVGVVEEVAARDEEKEEDMEISWT